MNKIDKFKALFDFANFISILFLKSQKEWQHTHTSRQISILIIDNLTLEVQNCKPS